MNQLCLPVLGCMWVTVRFLAAGYQAGGVRGGQLMTTSEVENFPGGAYAAVHHYPVIGGNDYISEALPYTQQCMLLTAQWFLFQAFQRASQDQTSWNAWQHR